MANPVNTLEDVWRYVEKRGPDECWPWTSNKTGGGYGSFTVNYKGYKAHRIVYFLTFGGIKLAAPKSNYSKQFVLHRCDNPPCCNPAHLFLGCILKNMADKVAKNRQHHPRGELQGRATLSNADAVRIREAALFGAKPKDLAPCYGTAIANIYRVLQGRTFR